MSLIIWGSTFLSRTVRLLELLVRLQTLRQFTVQALADEFGVSRRTMLRDLQSLSELGVPLAATSGPHGGYRLIREQQLPPLMLTADEAIALVVSYESLQQYADSPFDFDKSAAMAKIQGALPMRCGIAHVMTTDAAPMYHCGQTV